MKDVAYSREAMRALLMLGSAERSRAIETVETLASVYDDLCIERDVAAAAGGAEKPTQGKSADTDPATRDETGAEDDTENTDSAEKDTETKPAAEAVKIPGTLPLGTTGNFCLAPFSKTGDFVVALGEQITVVSLIDVTDSLNEASSE